jgi:hypothetical protein
MATQQGHLFEVLSPWDRSRGGNAYSRLANETFAANKETIRLEILAFIRERGRAGATADEIAEAWQCSPNHCAPRATELIRDGRLIRSGQRRKTRAGCYAAVLIAKEFGTGGVV